MNGQGYPIGQGLWKVEYELLFFEEFPSASAVIDDVAMAVRLIWADGAVIRIGWRNPAYWEDEGLLFDGAQAENAACVDVSTRWSSCVGARLDSVVVSRSLAETRRIWAMNFDFDNDNHLVIALGELDEGMPSYMPDNLIVTDSEAIARAYWPANSEEACTETPAWGEFVSDWEPGRYFS